MTDTATVETLTAEVRVLMVGNRQVTLSVARQLDRISAANIKPFGRVKIDKETETLIGTDEKGVLSVAEIRNPVSHPNLCRRCKNPAQHIEHRNDWLAVEAWLQTLRELPLIVLAGLK